MTSIAPYMTVLIVVLACGFRVISGSSRMQNMTSLLAALNAEIEAKDRLIQALEHKATAFERLAAVQRKIIDQLDAVDLAKASLFTSEREQ